MILQMTEQLYKEALSEIAELDYADYQDLSMLSEQQASIASKYFNQLKRSVLEYQFDSQEEEISFFKSFKPKIASLFIYYSEVHRIELLKPRAGKAALENYYQSEQHSIQRFYERNREIYSYYRAGATHLDALLFLRSSQIQSWLCRIKEDRDERFSTPADNLFARFLARERLEQYLDSILSNPIGHFMAEEQNSSQITWTGDTINLLENVFGWYYTGQINNGQASIAELVRKLERVFNVNLGKPYRRFAEIRQRKRLSKTKFLDEMSQAIIKKIEDDDRL